MRRLFYFPLSSSEVPSTPVGPIEFSDIKKTSATMTWKPSEKDGGSPIKHYTVEKREKFKRSWMQVSQVKPSETLSLVLSDLAEGKEYELQVIAVNDIGASKPLESDRPLVPKSPYSEYIYSKIQPRKFKIRFYEILANSN